MLFPSSMRKHEPVWAAGNASGKLDQQGMSHAEKLRDELDHPPADWLVLDRNYTTQSIDTAALEADNANCWYDASTQSLHMIVPTQGPTEVAASAAGMAAKCRFPV
jgi:CO/xanthine dehydrogenase Mo-binding subunit